MKILQKKLIYVFLIAVALTPLLWFFHHRGELINGLDTNFPLNPTVWFGRRLLIWNDSLNGGTHMNSSVAGLFFHLLQYIPYKIGFSLGVTQKLTFIFWFGMTAFAGYIFSITFLTKKHLLQAFFVILYCFNIYLFNTWENSKVANLALVVGLPLFISVIENYRQRKISIYTLFSFQVIIAFITAGTGINPAYFAAIVGGVLMYFIIFLLKEDRGLLLKGITISAIAIIGASLFWILPLLDFLFFSSKVSTLEGIGFTNWVASLSQNTSLVNVLRLMGAWDWYVKDNANVPIYIPYAVKYFNSLPFIAMSFVVPLMAFSALFLRNKKRLVELLFLVLYVVIGVFLGAGLHEPTSGLFSILLNKVPFFSFFRSPWYIFTPYTIIGLGGLATLFLDQLNPKLPKIVYLSSVCVLIVGYLLYSYPLWTGKIFRPGREDSFYVTTPAYVFDFADYFTNSSNQRIITYPDDQLEKFNWGYKGTDSFLGLLVNKEVYAPSFNYPNKYVESYLNTFYLRLKAGNTTSATKMLPEIGVDSLLLKKDASTLSPEISQHFASYQQKSFGEWSLIDFGKKNLVSVVKNLYLADQNPEFLSFIIPYLPPESAIISENDTQFSKFSNYIKPLALVELKPLTTSEGQSYSFETETEGDYTFVFEQPLVQDKTSTILLDDKQIKSENRYDDASSISLHLSKGKHEVLVNYPVSIVQLPEKYIGEISLSQVDQKEQRITIPVSNFNPFVTYELNFDFRYVYGDLPQIELVQSYSRAPLKVETVKLFKNQDWLPTRFLFNPVPLDSKLEIIFKLADNVDSSISKAVLRNMKINRIVTNRLFIYENPLSQSSESKVELTKNSSVSYTSEVTNVPNGYLLLFKENYQNGWVLSSNDYIGRKPVHLQANGMYNLWFIPVGGKSEHIDITFKPQKNYIIALALTGVFLTLALITLVISLRLKNVKNK